GDYADRVVAWRTPGQAENSDFDRENSLYRSAGLLYVPRHGPFQHVGELWLVYGIPAVLLERVMPYVTVLRGRAQINVVDAAPQVIAALPGVTPESLQTVLAARAAGLLDKTTLPSVLGSAQGLATSDAGKSVRVGVRVDFDNGRRSGGEVVILLPDDGTEP